MSLIPGLRGRQASSWPWEAWHYPLLALSGNTAHRWYIPAFMGGIVVVGLLIFYVARAVRRGQGIDLDLVYRELPPD